VGRGENVFFLHIPLATKLWIYLHLPSHFLQKVDSDYSGLFISLDIILNSILNTCFNKLFEEEKND
jgi:hypothetical protein